VPALVIAADRDSVVPAQHARRLYEGWGGPGVWLEIAGAGHNDVDSYPAYWDAVHRFLANAGQPGKMEKR
jgi:pimeloyl-ACP methyl ester carboxylesterase